MEKTLFLLIHFLIAALFLPNDNDKGVVNVKSSPKQSNTIDAGDFYTKADLFSKAA